MLELSWVWGDEESFPIVGVSLGMCIISEIGGGKGSIVGVRDDVPLI
jgi:hypothetical protein